MIGALVVAALRLLTPLTILRYPFWGMLLAVAADAADIVILDKTGWGVLAGKDYHALDKLLDSYYLAFAFFASLKWKSTSLKNISASLFGWRIIGVAAFEITGARQVLFLAPNVFENFYIITAGVNQFFPGAKIYAWRRTAAVLVIAAAPKIVQEYVMHFLEFRTWLFLKNHILFWLYP